jgi:hypothetical protein
MPLRTSALRPTIRTLKIAFSGFGGPAMTHSTPTRLETVIGIIKHAYVRYG